MAEAIYSKCFNCGAGRDPILTMDNMITCTTCGDAIAAEDGEEMQDVWNRYQVMSRMMFAQRAAQQCLPAFTLHRDSYNDEPELAACAAGKTLASKWCGEEEQPRVSVLRSKDNGFRISSKAKAVETKPKPAAAAGDPPTNGVWINTRAVAAMLGCGPNAITQSYKRGSMPVKLLVRRDGEVYGYWDEGRAKWVKKVYYDHDVTLNDLVKAGPDMYVPQGALLKLWNVKKHTIWNANYTCGENSVIFREGNRVYCKAKDTIRIAKAMANGIKLVAAVKQASG